MSQALRSLHDAGPIDSSHRIRPSTLDCCCGRSECAYLQHNSAALAGLERDLETAAQVGQALLHRHESYMSEAEGDRSRMLLEMETLERHKREMLAENARIIEENRELLEQLEDMNKAITDSDAHIKSLTTTLESTQLEMKQLSISASRVAQLESQIDAMEAEQAELQQKLITTEEDEKSAVQRWRQAECTLRDLQDQLERIEKETRDERERHVELLGRMERRRAVERELDSAAGRLKGAAATSSLGRNKPGTGVVTHFVRDILQDNANLQMGIVELREMLQNSNEEVQNLREQILLHQPLASEPNDAYQQKRLPLSDELDAKAPQVTSQEFHVHHHYHSPTPSLPQRKERLQIPIHRRQKKRRPIFPPVVPESPPRGFSRMQPISHRPHGSTSSTSTILSQTSVSIPPSNGRQWSLQPTSAAPESLASSMPSSPQSAYRTSSIFDRVENGFDSSRPTSPESNGFASPSIRPYHHKGASDVSFQSISGPAELQDTSPGKVKDEASEFADYTAENDTSPYLQPPIPEEREDTPSIETTEAGKIPSHHPTDTPEPSSPLQYHQVKRASSHDSLLSVSGMDIHTLRNRPSQLLSPYSIRTPSRIATAGTEFSSSPPVISPMNIIVPTVSLNTGDNASDSRSLLSSVVAAAADATPPGSLPNPSSPLHHHPDDIFTSPTPSISKRVGGWVLGKWGITPMASNGDLHSSRSSRRSSSSSNTATKPPLSPAAASAAAARSAAIVMARPPGVNQKGPIFGLRPPAKPPTVIQPQAVDEEALQESLLE
ncbi:hypothetical protein FQN50_009401 [Emmonsiellopsis sp. PD_5]|nr:hypothetical protein FQN50_009401 [Emmonsiellopsis sp. PD_5]